MALLDPIHVLLGTIPRPPHIPYHIPGHHRVPNLQALRIGPVLPQMSVIMIPKPVEAPYPNTPAPILVPAQRLHRPGLHRYHRRAHRRHHVVAQVLSPIAVAPARAEVVIVAVWKGLCDGRVRLKPIPLLPALVPLNLELPHKAPQHRPIGLPIVGIAGRLRQVLPGLKPLQSPVKIRLLIQLKIPAISRRKIRQQIYPVNLLSLLMGLHVRLKGPLQHILGHLEVHPLDKVLFGLLPRCPYSGQHRQKHSPRQHPGQRHPHPPPLHPDRTEQTPHLPPRFWSILCPFLPH